MIEPVERIGTGIIYSKALVPLLAEKPGLFDALEIEPQTFWQTQSAIKGPFKPNKQAFDRISGLPYRKLIHSVGVPLGGTRKPNREQLGMLKALADQWDAPWISEHLSVGGTPHQSAGFLLPPLQTDEGVALCAGNAQIFREAMGRPVALETGVAYIKRREFEMSDGAFLRHVTESADCGILLDVHNIYCNHKNGRFDLDRYLSEIPLDRVYELHIASGFEFEGHYIDAHDGRISEDVAAIARQILPELTNLGAINYEVYETFLMDEGRAFDLQEVADHLHELWTHVPERDQGGKATEPSVIDLPLAYASKQDAISPPDWERDLCGAVWGGNLDSRPFGSDAQGIALYNRMISSFRGSLLVRALPRLMRALFLFHGRDVDLFLSGYYSACPPELFAVPEGTAFVRWLREADPDFDPVLGAMASYDLAILEMAHDLRARVVEFPFEPTSGFEALVGGRLPEPDTERLWELEVIPDPAFIKAVDNAGFTS